MPQAINTIDTYLMKGTESSGNVSYAKLVDIKDYSDIYGDAEELDITTLSDDCYKYIKGLQANEKMTFTCNYTYSDFTTLKALENAENHYQIAFGKSGSTYGTEGTFSFKGYLAVKIIGKGVNEVREMEVSIIRSTDITNAQASA